MILALAVVGCSGETAEFTETKRIDEKVTQAELKAFLRVVRALPDGKLPELPAVFASPPEWNQARTLPIGELVNEEEVRISDRFSPEWLARRLHNSRPLARALRRERMTTEQFVGLTLAIGVAIARENLPDTRGLDDVRRKGQDVVERLKADTRPFSGLGRSGRHHVLQQAVWITRIDRIGRLLAVPPENIALVRAHRDELNPLFPVEFNENPLAAVVDRLEEQGLPFEELAESGYDSEIEWNAREAAVGRDAPDDEHRQAVESGETTRRPTSLHN